MNKTILRATCALGALALSAASSMAADVAAVKAAPVTASDTGTTIGELVVTAERREENLQDAPLAVSAFSAGALKASRLDGGQNLIQQIPNTNFARADLSGFNLKIRGIGTDVLATEGTAGVSINENELPVASSHFEDADFFDVDRVEVARGPQGTLYGRNATGGAVDLITTKPSETFGGYGSIQYGNYNGIRATGAVNLPLGDDLAVRVAGIRLVQDGFGVNSALNTRVDNRDLGAIRTTISFNPSPKFSAYLMYEHFGEDDNRNRIGKQLCIKDPGPTSVGGQAIAPAGGSIATNYAAFLSQGCQPGSLYQNAAYGTVNSNGTVLGVLSNLIGLSNGLDLYRNNGLQNHNLHDISSPIQPTYKVNEDLVDLHLQYNLSDNLTLTSITGFNHDVQDTTEDYNRIIPASPYQPVGLAAVLFPGGVVQDPQLGPSNRLLSYDRYTSDTKEYTEELRLGSSFSGKFNFVAGAFYSEETSPFGSGNYYVQSNAFTAFSQFNNAIGGAALGGPLHIDPNSPATGEGHNYYDERSGGGYLKSYAGFGEVYYNILSDLKLTLGGRYTVDQLYNPQFPQGLLSANPNNGPTYTDGVGGFPSTVCTTSTSACIVPQRVTYREFTGRANLDWTPTLSFTDKTLVYATYSRGYKGGGFNPSCQASLGASGSSASACGYSLTYSPEFIDAFEIGTKNTVLGGRLTLNADAFYYNYTGYQISRIVAETSVNENINAKIYGAEFESVLSPVRHLTFNVNVGYLHTAIDNGQTSIDSLNLTQGNTAYTVVKTTGGTNCLAPTAAVAGYIAAGLPAAGLSSQCFAPAAPGGVSLRDGVPADLSGHQLPNSPKFTVSAGAQYVFELPADWRATLRGDYYWQDDSFGRIYNAVNDQLRGYSVVNATVTFANAGMGLDLQLFVKNAFNAQPITANFVNDAVTGLYQNVFTLDPRTYGAQLTKRF